MIFNLFLRALLKYCNTTKLALPNKMIEIFKNMFFFKTKNTETENNQQQETNTDLNNISTISAPKVDNYLNKNPKPAITKKGSCNF